MTLQNIHLLPVTKSGRWSLGLILIFFASLISFFLVTTTDYGRQTSATTFWEALHNLPLLSVPIVLAAFSGIAAATAGIYSMIQKRERSIAVAVAIAIGLFALYFLLGEIISPH